MSATSEPTRAAPPWSFTRLPGYSNASPIQSVDADSITEVEFRSEFVNRNRPCRLVGAVKHWRAVERWSSPSYLRDHTPADGKVLVRRLPLAESSALASPTLRPALTAYNTGLFTEMSFHEYLRRLTDEDPEIVVKWQPIRKVGMYAKLHEDIGAYPFIPRLGKSRYYPRYRTFFFRRSYTDWHFHPADEALMTQIASTKEVLLLPPDEGTWKMLSPLLRENMHLFDRYGDLADRIGNDLCNPLRAVVEPGDALFIPAFWWHAVASVGTTFGSTLISTFPTPAYIQGDLRFPALRSLYAHTIESRSVPGTNSFHRLFALLATIPYAEGHRAFRSLTNALKGLGGLARNADG